MRFISTKASLRLNDRVTDAVRFGVGTFVADPLGAQGIGALTVRPDLALQSWPES
jgi:hypothetical protein